MLPSKIHTLAYKDRFLGCFSKNQGIKTKIFGFIKKPQIELVKKHIKSDVHHIVHQKKNDEYVIKCEPTSDTSLHPKPIRKQLMHIMSMDVHECIPSFTLNNLELVLIDDIKMVDSDFILYSNYKIDVEIDDEIIKEYIEYIYEQN